MSFFLINDIRLNLPMGWVPFQLLYLGPFSNVRCTNGYTNIVIPMANYSQQQHPLLNFVANGAMNGLQKGAIIANSRNIRQAEQSCEELLR